MSICAKIVFSQNCGDVKNEVFEKNVFFFFFSFLSFSCWTNRNRKNMEKGQQKPIKISVFKVVIQKCEK